jgi:hypothetical protein
LAAYLVKECEMTPTGYSRGLPASSRSREEWLIDDAIDDTFPASDPVSHGQPGSLVNLRYAARERNAQRRWSTAFGPAGWWLLAAATLACLVVLARRRR